MQHFIYGKEVAFEDLTKEQKEKSYDNQCDCIRQEKEKKQSDANERHDQAYKELEQAKLDYHLADKEEEEKEKELAKQYLS